MHEACGGRRIRPEKLHATLAFLGDTPAGRVPALIEAAGRVAAPSFELFIDQSGYWKQSRIAWAGASATPLQLESFAEQLRARLSEAGFSTDPKPFVAHITLLRDAKRPASMPVLPPLRWPVQGFALVCSAGGRYEVLHSWGAARSK
jgi:2'-5' RNA ligase